jgi:AraC-like DNA-binding protein
VSAYLAMLPARIDGIDPITAAQLAAQTLDLVALAFSMEAGRSARLSSRREVALYRLKAMIEARLCDPTLKPAAAAGAAGISVRYANDLLSQEGYSIERYILHRRLERARRALEDPAQARRSIGEIAFAWGFSDLSHFVRRFRSAYGLTPGDYRRRASERALEPASS